METNKVDSISKMLNSNYDGDIEIGFELLIQDNVIDEEFFKICDLSLKGKEVFEYVERIQVEESIQYHGSAQKAVDFLLRVNKYLLMKKFGLYESS